MTLHPGIQPQSAAVMSGTDGEEDTEDGGFSEWNDTRNAQRLEMRQQVSVTSLLGQWTLN